MRITFLINDFPPLGGGGYGFRFADMARVFCARGHAVQVVTSSGGGQPPPGDRTVRVLTQYGEVFGLRGVLRLVRGSRRDGRALAGALAGHRPEVIVIGNWGTLSSALWNVLRSHGAPLVLDVSNGWLVDLGTTHGNWFRIWEKPSRSSLRGALKAVVRFCLDHGPAALDTRFPGLGAARVYATAEHMAEEVRRHLVDELPPVGVCVSGIDLAGFPFTPTDRPVRRLLYTGRLKSTKGVDDAILALERLDPEATLTVVGVPDDADYESRLRDLAGRPGIAGRVEFRTPIERSLMPGLFAEHDVLVFPSVWDEPFSRLVLEAMACGLPVAATPCGGTAAVIRDGENGVLFPAEDPDALAEGVRRLADDGRFRQAVVRQAREDVEREYALDPALDRIERVLESVIDREEVR